MSLSPSLELPRVFALHSPLANPFARVVQGHCSDLFKSPLRCFRSSLLLTSTLKQFEKILSMPKTIERYRMNSQEMISNNKSTEQDIQQWRQDTDLMSKRIDALQDSKRKLMGENLESCSVDELHELESQLEQSISKVRGRKNHLLEEQVVELKEKERVLLEENALLQKQGRHTTFSLWKEPLLCLNASKAVVVPQCDEYRDVETDLYVGRPGAGGRRTQQLLKG